MFEHIIILCLYEMVPAEDLIVIMQIHGITKKLISPSIDEGFLKELWDDSSNLYFPKIVQKNYAIMKKLKNKDHCPSVKSLHAIQEMVFEISKM